MFGLFNRRQVETTVVAAEEQRSSLASPDEWLLELFGAAPVSSGVSVTPQNAMRCTTVRAAVEAIAEAIGGLPVHIYRRNGDARQRAPEHPAYALLHDQANDWTPSAAFLEQITRDALLHGNGYAFINRANGEPRELNRLRPEAVAVTVNSLTGEPIYTLSEGTGQRVIDRRDILHIAAPMGASFLRFTLMRWIKAIEGEVRLKLIAPEDRAEYYPEFLVDDLLRADLAARADSYGKLIAARVLNPNEVRAMENRAPYAGGEIFANPHTTSTTPTAPETKTDE